MAYVDTNFKTKKAFKTALAEGAEIRIKLGVSMFGDKTDGTEYIEGPWYPEPHKWYAQVTLKDGKVVSIK